MVTTSILGILCAPNGKKSPCYGLLQRALAEAQERTTKTSIHELRPKFDRRRVANAIDKADGLIIATPVHWFNVSVLAKRLIDEVLSEFDPGSDHEDWKLNGKPVGIIATCNEDGANQAIASIAMPLNHLGMFVPPWGTLIHNLEMPGHGENGWQDKPEFIGQYVAEYAKRRIAL